MVRIAITELFIRDIFFVPINAEMNIIKQKIRKKGLRKMDKSVEEINELFVCGFCNTEYRAPTSRKDICITCWYKRHSNMDKDKAYKNYYDRLKV